MPTTDTPQALREIAEARRRLESGDLDRLRETAGLSFADIGHELRADRWVVARWFRQTRRPDAENLLALVACLDKFRAST